MRESQQRKAIFLKAKMDITEQQKNFMQQLLITKECTVIFSRKKLRFTCGMEKNGNGQDADFMEKRYQKMQLSCLRLLFQTDLILCFTFQLDKL